MPTTPLHYVLAYFISRSWRGSFHLPALAVGSWTPDLENLVLVGLGYPVPRDRLVLHSLIGGATLGTLLAVLLTIYAYPAVIRSLLPQYLQEVQRVCRPSTQLVVSALLGVWSHVLIDATHHEYNPLFFPVTDASFNQFVLFQDVTLAQTVVHAVFILGGLLILYREGRKGPGLGRRLLIQAS